jgi:hypothetical protein
MKRRFLITQFENQKFVKVFQFFFTNVQRAFDFVWNVREICDALRCHRCDFVSSKVKSRKKMIRFGLIGVVTGAILCRRS